MPSGDSMSLMYSHFGLWFCWVAKWNGALNMNSSSTSCLLGLLGESSGPRGDCYATKVGLNVQSSLFFSYSLTSAADSRSVSDVSYLLLFKVLDSTATSGGCAFGLYRKSPAASSSPSTMRSPSCLSSSSYIWSCTPYVKYCCFLVIAFYSSCRSRV